MLHWCLAGALLAELAAVRLPHFGQVSLAAPFYLVAMRLHPGVTLGVAAVAAAFRAVAFRPPSWRSWLREVGLEWLPLLAAAVVAVPFRGSWLGLAAEVLAYLLVYLLLHAGGDGEPQARTATAFGLVFPLMCLLASAFPLALLGARTPWLVLAGLPMVLALRVALRSASLLRDGEALRTQMAVARLGLDKARLDRAETVQELSRKNEQLALVEGLAQSLARGPSVTDVLERVLETAQRWSQCASAVMFAPGETRLLPRAYRSPLAARLAAADSFAWTEPVVQEAWVRSVAVPLRPEHDVPGRLMQGEGMAIAFPLHTLGVVYLGDPERPPLREEEVHMLRTLAAQAALSLQCTRYFAQLQESLGAYQAAYAKLQASEAQLVQAGKMAAVGQLAAGLAHEINTPLGTVILGIDAASEMLDSKPQYARERLEDAHRSAARAQEIVKRLLYYSREGRHESQRFDLNTVITDTVTMLRHPFQLDKVQVEFKAGAPAPVLGSPSELQQVLMNLLINARDAVLEGSERRVAVRLESAGGWHRLEVSDRGPGIPLEVQPRIFDPFFTTKPVGQGTGLGLSLSQQIVERHGGTLTVSSQPGYGSLFTVSLPHA